MLDEEMDDIIKEATERHHPVYNDKAWEQMEKKLDKHLPQKTDRRRIIFFLALFLLIGAGTVFTMLQFNNKTAENTLGGKSITIAEKQSGKESEQVNTKNETAGNTDMIAPENKISDNPSSSFPVKNLPGNNKKENQAFTTNSKTPLSEKNNSLPTDNNSNRHSR